MHRPLDFCKIQAEISGQDSASTSHRLENLLWMVEVDLPRGQYRCLGEALEVDSRRANVMAMFGRSRC